MKNIIDTINKNYFTKDNKKLFLIVFALGMLIHFMLYSQNIVAYDGYWHYGSFLSKGWEVSLGRFMLPFVDLLRGTVVCSFLSSIISISLVSITTIVLCDLLKIKKNYLKIITGLLLLSIPTFSLTLMYAYIADSYSYALLFSVLSIYFLDKDKRLLSIIMIIITLGFYQAYIGVILTLYVIVKMIHLLEDKKNIKEFFKKLFLDIITVAIGMVIYYVVLSIILKVLNLNITSYSGGNNILSIDTITNIFTSIGRCYDTFFKFYFTDSIVINTDMYAMKILYIVLFSLIIINLGYLTINKKIYKEPLKIVILLIAVVIYPVITCSIELIATERTINLLMATSLYLVFVILIKEIDSLDKNNLLKITSVIFASVFIWLFILIDNATYIASSMFKDQMTNVGNRVLESVERHEDYEEDLDILIVGKMDFDIHNDMLLKLTYFDVSDINMWTWQIFLEDHLGSKKKVDLSNTYDDIVNNDEIYSMGIYPEDNSIKKIGNTMVVRIGH